MTRRLKCYQCKEEFPPDDSLYVGPSRPHCSVDCAHKTVSELPRVTVKDAKVLAQMEMIPADKPPTKVLRREDD